jgi:hypothetical protein
MVPLKPRQGGASAFLGEAPTGHAAQSAGSPLLTPTPPNAGSLLLYDLASPLSRNVLHGLGWRTERPAQCGFKTPLHFLGAELLFRTPIRHPLETNTKRGVCRRPVNRHYIVRLCCQRYNCELIPELLPSAAWAVAGVGPQLCRVGHCPNPPVRPI